MRKYLVILILALLAVSGCDIHEYPVGEHDVDVALNLVFDYDLPQYKIIDYKTRADEPTAAGRYPYQARYVVDFYRDDNETVTPNYRFTFTGSNVEDLSRTEHVLVAPARYRILAWTDFVETEGSLPFYDIVDMKNITFHGDNPDVISYTGKGYKGNNDFKDAFRGEQTLDLSAFNQNGSKADVTVDMQRPLAKFNIIATDKDQLITFWLKQLEARGIETKDGTENVDLNLFNVRIFYNGYLPSVFNNFTDRPVSSDTGILFEGKFNELQSGDVELAFDYVMVNGKESSVNISIAIYDDLWEEISVIPGINIPLLRSHLTTVRGKFLTTGTQSGIAINPAYDGEINIFIN